MAGLDKAKTMEPYMALSKIAESMIVDYGFYSDVTAAQRIVEGVAAAKELGKRPRIAAGLVNNDYDGIFMELFDKYVDRIQDGMKIVGYATGAVDYKVYFKEKFADKALEMDGEVTDVISLRAMNHQECLDVVLHFMTYVAISTYFENDFSIDHKIYLAVKKDGVIGPLEPYKFGTKVSEIVGDTFDAKAIVVGNKLYSPAVGAEVEIGPGNLPSNGIIEVLSNKECLIDYVYKEATRQRKESCGKCMFCREGGIQIQTIMNLMTLGKGSMEDLELIKDLEEAMPYSSICSIGRSAANTVTGLTTYFMSEIEDHVIKRRCAADVCQSFMNIYIDPSKCTGCCECLDACPEDAIEGDTGFIHMIDEGCCTKCGKCAEVCEDDAVVRAPGRVPKLPTKLTKVGKWKRR